VRNNDLPSHGPSPGATFPEPSSNAHGVEDLGPTLYNDAAPSGSDASAPGPGAATLEPPANSHGGRDPGQPLACDVTDPIPTLPPPELGPGEAPPALPANGPGAGGVTVGGSDGDCHPTSTTTSTEAAARALRPLFDMTLKASGPQRSPPLVTLSSLAIVM